MTWNTDFNTAGTYAVQDVATAEMFWRAFQERQFNFEIAEFNPLSAQDFWWMMQGYVFGLGRQFLDPSTIIEGQEPKTWIQSLGQENWPPPKGFKRVYPREINTLSMPGESGQVARFAYVGLPANPREQVTPLAEKVYSGLRFRHDGTKWVKKFDAYDQDTLSKYGTIQGGDYLLGHILNDLRDAINLCTHRAVPLKYWITNLENNAQVSSAAGSVDLSMSEATLRQVTQQVRNQANANWIAAGSWDYRSSDEENYIQDGAFSGSGNLLFKGISNSNLHGTGYLKSSDGAHLQFKAPKSSSFGGAVLVPLTKQDDPPIYVKVFDGASNKWVKVARFEKLPEEMSIEFNIDVCNNNTIKYSTGGLIPLALPGNRPMAQAVDVYHNDSTIISQLPDTRYAILQRIYGYPVVVGFNGTEKRPLKRAITFYMTGAGGTSIYDDFKDDWIYQKGWRAFSGPMQTSDFEIIGPKLGRVGPRPEFGPLTSGSQSRGYETNAQAIMDFSIEGGFKYKKGYTGS